MADGNFSFLATVKALLNIKTEDFDTLLQMYIDNVEQSICNYCNIDELPSALFFTACNMAVDLYRENTAKNDVGKVTGNVTSISEGGRTVGFANGVSIQVQIDDKITKTKELNRFRKAYKL